MKKVNTNKVMEDEDVTYIVDDDVIDDSLCPKCMEKVTDKTEFCNCGFYVQAAKRSGYFSFVFFIIILTASISLIMTNTDFLPKLSDEAAHKISDKEKFIASASPVIQVKNSLKHAGYLAKIYNLKEQDYKHPNVLVIVIKPEYWFSMKKSEKKFILDEVNMLWKEAYKGDDPQVMFANPEPVKHHQE